MQINFPFWIIPVGLVAIGIVGMMVITRRSTSDYDFITGLFGLGWAAVFIVAAIGLTVGKYFF
jgi:hypothetical protein